MAKSESKSGWEAVKPTKTKPAKAAEKTEQKSKSPPKAKIVANTSPKESQKSKPDVSSKGFQGWPDSDGQRTRTLTLYLEEKSPIKTN